MKYYLIIIIFLFSAEIYSQNEPWKRPLKICTGTDGINFYNVQTFQDSSGVPNLIKLSSGTLACVFQWFRQPVGSPSWDRVAVKFSTDNGITWTSPVPIIVNNLPNNFTRPFDPTLTLTENGRIRLFFSCGMNMVPDTSVNTYSAISDDGINYTMESGFRFSMPDRPVLDPAVIKFRNLWHLANPLSNQTSGGAFHNISGDGLNFTRVQDIVSDGSHSWIGNYMINDTSELRFYGSGMNIWYSTSPNGGEWSSFINTNIQGGDPSVLKLTGSSYLMIYTGQPYTVGIPVNEAITGNDFSLMQNFPNPFNPTTKINYTIPKQGLVTIKIYSVIGNEVSVLVNEHKAAGSYSVEFNASLNERGSNFPSGIYFYKLSAGSYSDTKAMILLK